MDIANAMGVSDKWGEEMTILVAVALLLNMILIHIEWKRIENLVRCRACWVDDAIDDVDGFADNAIEAVSVVHGKWMEKETFHNEDDIIGEWQSARCSECGKYHTTPYMYYFDNFNFCPNCGCRMKGADDE